MEKVTGSFFVIVDGMFTFGNKTTIKNVFV